MVKGKKEMTNVKDVLHKNLTLPLMTYQQKIREHDRHAMLSFLSSLPIQILCIMDIEANRFYDRNHQMYEAALLTRCYTQHAIRPLIDSEISHKRHFIKIPFINKGIDFIDLPNIYYSINLSHHLNLIISKILSRPLFFINITNQLEI